MAVRDIILIGVLVFAFGLAFFSSHYMLGQAFTKTLNATAINESVYASDAIRDSQSLTSRFDYIVFALFMGLGLALIITGWFIGGNPIFSFIYFLVIIIAVIMSTIFANAWEEISQTSTLSSSLTAFPLTNNLLLLLPVYIAVVGFIGLVVLFAKPYIGNQE